MKLISLLEKLEYTCLQGSTDQEVKNVIYDSRKVEAVSYTHLTLPTKLEV